MTIQTIQAVEKYGLIFGFFGLGNPPTLVISFLEECDDFWTPPPER